MRILFLDIDGVLNSRRFFEVDSKRAHRKARGTAKAQDPVAAIDPVAVAYLNTVVARTGCKIVISSTWRNHHFPEEIAGFLRERGFVGEVIDATPKIERGIEIVPRGEEIAMWLREHPDVVDYAIVDDQDDMGELRYRLVQTTSAEGLGLHEAEQLVRGIGRRHDAHLCKDDYEALATPGTEIHVGTDCGTTVVIWAPPACECMCGTLSTPHERGVPDACEYHEHHCESCHERVPRAAARCPSAKEPEMKDNCNPELRERGETVLITSKIAPEKLTTWVRKVAELSGQRVGWYYHNDRVRMIVCCLGDRAKVETAIAVLLPEHNELFRAAQAMDGKLYN